MTRNSASTTLALGSLGAQLSSNTSGTTAAHTSSAEIRYPPSPLIVTATTPEPLNVNDATTRVWEQPPGWYGGADSSVAFSVGLFGLTALPSSGGPASRRHSP